MGKCSNCKYGKTDFEGELNHFGSKPMSKDMTLLNSNPDSVMGDMYGKCKKGNQDTFVNWWKNASNIPASQTPHVPCYEPTEFNKRTDELVNKIDEFCKLVDELIDKSK